MRLPVVGQVVGRWETDPLWARFYDLTVEHPRLGDPVWRWGMGSDLSLLLAAVRSLGALPAGSRVLDVPCGGGVGLRGLRPGQGVDYVAADVSPAMLRRTTGLAERLGVTDQLTTRVTDAADLPDPDGSYDVVLSLMGLHCFDDPRTAAAELARVVAPGGRLIGSTLVTDSGLRHEPGRRVGRAAGLLGPMCSRLELHSWLRAAGLTRITLRSSGPVVHVRATRAA